MQTFWEHLDALRHVLVRIVVALVLLTGVMFVFKEELFGVVLAPSSPQFVFYRWLCLLAQQLDMPQLRPDNFSVALINTQLTGQFMAHIRVAFYAAAVCGAPYVLWQLFGFVAPALYANERRGVTWALAAGSVLFMLGVLVNYLVIFPLSFRFLALYNVDEQVSNMIELKSYIDMLLMLTLMMGILFELPLVSVILAKLGIIGRKQMTKYRRHAVLAIVTVAAVITPTTDVFTLVLVSLPIYVLYEVSIVAVGIIGRGKA